MFELWLLTDIYDAAPKKINKAEETSELAETEDDDHEVAKLRLKRNKMERVESEKPLLTSPASCAYGFNKIELTLKVWILCSMKHASYYRRTVSFSDHRVSNVRLLAEWLVNVTCTTSLFQVMLLHESNSDLIIGVLVSLIWMSTLPF